MGAELAAAFPCAREVFQEVDDALDQHLSRLMAEGPESELTLTRNAQPALMAVSLAVVRVLAREGGFHLPERGSHVAGHSLGEYSALAATGALGLADTARLLRIRGEAMQSAVPVGQGAMAALMGLDLETVTAIAEEAAQDGGAGAVCAPANDNAPGQVVISGHAGAVARAIALAKARGAKRAVELAVSAPFHCALMQPAAEAMAQALDAVAIAAPALPVVANATATEMQAPETIRARLVAQVTQPVRWRESVLHLREAGVDSLVELGAGKVLSGLARRIDRKLEAVSLGTPTEIETFLESAT